MPLYKALILRSDDEKRQVMEYAPGKLAHLTQPESTQFVLAQKKSGGQSDFIMSHLVSENIGLADVERQESQEAIEKLALEKFQAVQEEAYKKGYEQGLEDGKEAAYQEFCEKISQSLSSLSDLFSNLESLRNKMIEVQEKQLIELVYHMAEKMALREISIHRETIVNVLKEAVQQMQDDEKITVYLSKTDIDFLTSIREQLQQDFDDFQRLKIEPRSHIQPGGCFIETNYGDIDAQVQTRLSQVWKSLSSHLPELDDKFSSDEGEQ